MSILNAQALIGTHPRLGAFALFAASRVSYDLYVQSGLRSGTEQDQLYAIGRDADGNVLGKVATDAKAGQSPHNYGLAIDLGPYDADRSDHMATADDERYNELGDLAKSFGVVWGGTFTLSDGSHDVDHFQVPNWPAETGWRVRLAVAVVLVVLIVLAVSAGAATGGLA